MKRAALSVLLLTGGCLDRRSSHQEAPVPNPPSGGQEEGADAEQGVGGGDQDGADAHEATEPRCVPVNAGVEICNGLDDDCDGVIDNVSRDLRQLQQDVLNCGECGNRCQPPNAEPNCREGVCLFTCVGGWSDIDGLPENGCEVQCVTTNGGVEECDGWDNDCDQAIDEDWRGEFACNDEGECGCAGGDRVGDDGG